MSLIILSEQHNQEKDMSFKTRKVTNEPSFKKLVNHDDSRTQIRVGDFVKVNGNINAEPGTKLVSEGEMGLVLGTFYLDNPTGDKNPDVYVVKFEHSSREIIAISGAKIDAVK